MSDRTPAVSGAFFTIGLDQHGETNGDVGGPWPSQGKAEAMASAGQIIAMALGRDPSLQARVDLARLEGHARDLCRELLEESDDLLTTASDLDVAHSKRVTAQLRGSLLQEVVLRVQNRLLMRRRHHDPELRWSFTRAELVAALMTIRVRFNPDGPLAGEIDADAMADAIIHGLEISS